MGPLRTTSPVQAGGKRVDDRYEVLYQVRPVIRSFVDHEDAPAGLFGEQAEPFEPRTADQVIQYLQEQLTKPTNYASDTRFEESLRGPVYEDNRDMTRYVLAAIAQTGMTGETWVDLWRMNERGTQYYFTIEHIFPKTENITQEWIDAFGSKEQAEEVRSTLVHTLGNLTLTGYNSDLGRMGFERKRDRKDSAGRYIGYRNGLNLNDDVVDKTKWDAGAIKARTDRLVSVALKLLRLQ